MSDSNSDTDVSEASEASEVSEISEISDVVDSESEEEEVEIIKPKIKIQKVEKQEDDIRESNDIDDLPSVIYREEEFSSEDEFPAVLKDIENTEENELIIIDSAAPKFSSSYEHNITTDITDFDKLFRYETGRTKEIKKIFYDKLLDNDLFLERFNTPESRESITQLIINKLQYKLIYDDYSEAIIKAILSDPSFNN